MATDSDDEEEEHDQEESPRQKRSRVDSLSPPPSRKKQNTNNERERYYGAEGEELPEDVPNGDDEDEESEDEDEEEVRIRTENVEKMRRNTKSVGTIAESGVIDRVDLHNFMCHKYTTVKFGPQINFLVGHNGSGKSAVLTGITMALGGNARSTNRATKGSGLVSTNDGATFAICSVRIKNKGPNAYQHAKFGDYITVERRINLDVSGSYKIKNSADKVVDSKKATLDAILDHFNIQVDNPMTVLTQDQSRQFLASSSARDKYNFFLKGTQLAQLTEEYEIIRANTEQMQTTLETKKGVLPDLKDAYKLAKTRAKEAQGAIGQKNSIEKLKHELAWSYVDEIEENINLSNNAVNDAARTVTRIEERLDIYRAAVNAAKMEEDETQEALAECAASTENEQQIADLHAKIKSNTEKMKALNRESRSVNQTIQEMQDTIFNYDKQIAEEESKLAGGTQAEREVTKARIKELNDLNSELALAGNNARIAVEDLDDQTSSKKAELVDVKASIDRALAERENIRGRLASLNRNTRDSYSNYHDQMTSLVNAINKHQWNDKPIGPIGMFVKLKDPRWSRILESFFAETLNAFVVTDSQDFAKLTALKRQVRCNIPIIKRAPQKEKWDLSQTEPHESILTIYRALDIQHPLIEAILLTDKHIEAAALVPKRPDGDALMRQNPRNVESCFSGDAYRLGGVRGGSSSVFMDAWKGGSRLTSDNSYQIKSLQNESVGIEQNLERLHSQKAELDDYLGKIHREKGKLGTVIKTSFSTLTKNNAAIDELDARLQEDEVPNNLAAITANKLEAQLELFSTSAQLEVLTAEIKTAAGKTAPWVAEREALEKEVGAVSKLEGKLRDKLQTSHATRLTESNNVEQYERKLAKQQEVVASYREQVEPMVPELAKRIEQASSICEKPVVLKKKDSTKLQKEIEILEKALKDREKRQGATLEQLVEDLEVRKHAARTASDQIKELSTLVNALVSAYEKRIDRWNAFRETISGRAKMQFAFHLSNRGFTGKLAFDHTRLRLNLRVTTEVISGGTQKNSSKDAKSLSGGEKSFSTICLLLTMWEAVGCPIRCLDEFDVFMDAVNRRISMKMMIDTAKAANATQFILITPSSMGDSAWGPEVKVNRMSDPGRGQGTLRMGA